jgi:hypothetical protein
MHVCLGSDSRVTGSRDLLDELRAAANAASVTAHELLRMVTAAPAAILRLPDAGAIAAGAPADLVVIPRLHEDAAESLVAARRADVERVVIGGRQKVGTPRFTRAFAARGVASRPSAIDGTEHVIDASLASALARCPIPEPGVHVLDTQRHAAARDAYRCSN